MKSTSFHRIACILIVLLISSAVGKRFIFRQDDIEDSFHSDIQMNLMNFFMNNSIPVSVGIIGNFVTGNDVPLYNTLKKCISLGKDRCALFNHGADAVYYYGSSTSVEDAYTHMKVCDDKVKSLFNGYQMEVFVPHQNSWNQNAITAAQMFGYKLISASTLPYSAMKYNLSTPLIQMPEHTTTGYIGAAGTWVAYHQNQTVADCVAADARGEVCVIMIHPHEFSSGAYTMTMLQQLVDSLYSLGFQPTSFHSMITQVKGSDSPSANPTQSPTTLSPTIVPTRSPTIAPTRSPTIAGTGQSGITDSSSSSNSANKAFTDAYHSSIDFLSAPPDWGIAVIVIVGVLVIAAFIYFARWCNSRGSNENYRSSVEKDIESVQTDPDDSIAASQIHNDVDKYVPSSVRRSYTLGEAYDGPVPLPPPALNSPARHSSSRTNSFANQSTLPDPSVRTQSVRSKLSFTDSSPHLSTGALTSNV